MALDSKLDVYTLQGKRKMIESLTKEQEDALSVYRDKWIEIGLSTEPTDYEASVKLISKLYSQQDLKVPTNFHLVDGPLSAMEKLKEYDIKDGVSEFCYGSQDASWLSFYDFCLNELGVKGCDKILPLIELAKVCGWWSAYEDLVVIQHRPIVIKIENKLSHREDGPAIEYRDGCKVWMIDGIRVNEKIVMNPENISVDEIHSESDLDKRSIMIDRKGWGVYLEETNSTCIDSEENLIENTREALYESPQGKRFVASCPTARLFSMGVPNDVLTCKEAQRWLGSESEEEDTINVIART